MESFNLNIIPGKDRPVCHASQYDIGRTIRVNLFEGFNVFTLDGTEVISISVRKPDGNVVTESVTNTSDSYVEFVTTEQMTACHGSNLCELKIEKGADVIGTMNFILEVEQDPLEGGVQSASEIDNLETQIAGMVATEVANQYDSANVIFDPSPVPGHGNGYAVTSEGVATEISMVNNAIALKQDATDANLQTTDTTVVGAINELNADKQNVTDSNLQTTAQTIVGAINELKSSLTYNAGDGIGISNAQLAGILTTGQKQIIIQIPVLKPVSASTATLNPDSLWSIRHVSGGYIISNAKLSNIGTYSLAKNGIGLVLTIDLTNAFTGAPNNTPVTASLSIDANNIISFS